MCKILVFGKDGQVGWELQRSLGLVSDVVFLGRKDQGGDFLNIDDMIYRIQKEKPEIIFNAAAYTAVDNAEDDKELAKQVNCDAVAAMASVCLDLDCLLIHYSTDYVFNGLGERPWKEDDPVEPINVYGSTKAMGEKAIINSGCNCYIFRTSWVYGTYGKNFVKTILRLLDCNNNIKVVNDQIGTPTPATFLADASSWIALNKRIRPSEIVNIVPNGVTSWYLFAQRIAQIRNMILGTKCESNIISPILSKDYPMKAQRPSNSRLDNHKLQSLLPKNVVKEWSFYADRIIKEMLSSRLVR